MPRKSRAELAVVSRLADHHRRITAPDGMSPEETALFRRSLRPRPRRTFVKAIRRFCEPIAKPSSLVNWHLYPPNKVRALWAIGKNAVA